MVSLPDICQWNTIELPQYQGYIRRVRLVPQLTMAHNERFQQPDYSLDQVDLKWVETPDKKVWIKCHVCG